MADPNQVPLPGPANPPPTYQVLQYHGLPPSPPELDVRFTSCNIRSWEKAIVRYARMRDILPAITGQSQGLDPHIYSRMQLEVQGIIEPSITESTFKGGLNEDVLDLPPNELIAAVKAFCDRSVHPSVHEQLRTEATNLTIDRDESIDDYIERHLELRRRMLRSKVPGMENETHYIPFIIKGLRTRPSMQQQTSSLLVSSHPDITTLHLTIRTIASNQEELWSQRGRGRRGGRRGRGRGRGRGAASIYDSDKTDTDHRSDSSQAGAFRARGRGRGRGRGKIGRTANAVMGSDSASQQEDEHIGDEYGSDPVNSEFTSYTLAFTVDSACHPTYIALQNNPPPSNQSGHATVADGRSVPVSDHFDVTFATSTGRTFTLHRVCAARFDANLLSVPQLVDELGCHVLFRAKDVLFVDPTQKNQVIARASRQGNRYTLRLKLISAKPQITENSVRKSPSRPPLHQSACAITPHRVLADPPPPPPPPIQTPHMPPSPHPPNRTPQPRTTKPAQPARPWPVALLSSTVSAPRQPQPRTVRPPRPNPYLPTPRAQNQTNSIPFPSHLPDVAPKQRALVDSYYNWHLRLNHAPLTTLHDMAADSRHGLPSQMQQSPPPMTCSGCNVGHHSRSSHKSTTPRPLFGHTVATDLLGPLPKTSEGHQHVLTVTELHTRMRFICLLRDRKQTPRALSDLLTHIVSHTGQRIARVRCDNANEYLTRQVLALSRRDGFAVDPTIPHTPQQNAVAERFNRTLIARVRATLSSMQLPFNKYWSFCALNTTEKLNLMRQSTIDAVPRDLWDKNRSPRSPSSPRSLDLNQFRAFGEYGYIPLLQAIKTKAEPRSLLVRYLSTPKTGTFRVLDPAIGQILTCRAVDYRPYNPAYDPQRFIAHALPLDEGHKRRVNLHYVIPHTASAVSSTRDSNDPSTPTSAPDLAVPAALVPDVPDPVPAPDDVPDAPAPDSAHRVALGDPSAAAKRSTHLKLPMATDLPPPPRNLPEARRHLFAKQWRQAYAEERELLTFFGTFNLVDKRSLPRGTLVPRAQIKFVYKENDDGQVIGFKARIVYPGNRLTDGVHYDSKDTATYSADRDSLRFVIALASQQAHQLYHVDLKSAFLHERFKGKKKLYMQPLHDFDGTMQTPGLAYMLAANLYGTPQACKVYIQGAYQHLRKHGYVQCRSDHNVFRLKTQHGSIVMALTIDDFLVAASNRRMYTDLLQTLSLKYRTKDLGPASRILNWTLRRPQGHPTNYHISQPHKIQQFIDLMGMSSSHPVPSPQAKGHLIHARKPDEQPLPLTHPYAAALGVLRYIADCTRPDVAYVTGALARCTKDPTMRHWRALQYVARYLKGTKNTGVHYHGKKMPLQAYADADFAGCPDTRQSTHGNVLFYAGSPISWCSRRIKTVVISSCAAEYISNSKAGEHVVWLRSLIREVCGPPNGPTILHNDNTAAETIAKSRGQTKRSKYIEVRWHHIRDLVSRNIIDIYHLPSQTLVADVLTKCLYVPQFQAHARRLQLTQWKDSSAP